MIKISAKRYLLNIFALLYLFFTVFSVVHAFGAGPSIRINNLPPNHIKEIEITVTRAYAGPKEKVAVTISDSIKDIVTIKHGASLAIENGSRSVKIPLILRATNAQLGENIGEIKVSQLPGQVEDGVSSNLIDIPLSVNINVSTDQSNLLSLSSSHYSWRAKTNDVLLRFNINNERTYDSGITKVVFSIVKNGDKPIETSIETKVPLIASETDQTYNLNIPVGANEYGTWEIKAKYFDEKGMLISAPIMQTIFVNPQRTAHMQRVRYFMYVIVAALVIAALFMGDYYYLRKKHHKPHH